MTAQDLAAIVKGVAPAVLHVVQSAVAPLALKVASLEAQLANVQNGKDGAPGIDGKSGDIGPAGLQGEPGKDGKDGVNGKDADPVTMEMVMDALLSLKIKETMEASVKEYLEAHTPKDGKDGQVGPAGSDGIDGKDGVGLAGTLIGKDGQLVVTLTDGTVKELGPVVGRDGEKGADGNVGLSGANGVDGKDGTLEDLQMVYDGERTVSFSRKDGTPVDGGTIKFPIPIDRGVYSSEKAYETGDFLSYGGSAWVCKADCQGKQPGTNEGAAFWRLAVKRGNDGKAGPSGPSGMNGKDGAPGRDGTKAY